MKISLVMDADGVRLPDGELWVYVLSSEVVNVRQVLESLAGEHAATFAPYDHKPSDFYFERPTPAERAEGFRFKDRWIFPRSI